MRIQGWELTISPDGQTRAAKHVEDGVAMSVNGRFIGHADVPREVFLWLIRPLLRTTWDAGCIIGLGCPFPANPEEAYTLNPYSGEPPNKDKDVS